MNLLWNNSAATFSWVIFHPTVLPETLQRCSFCYDSTVSELNRVLVLLAEHLSNISWVDTEVLHVRNASTSAVMWHPTHVLEFFALPAAFFPLPSYPNFSTNFQTKHLLVFLSSLGRWMTLQEQRLELLLFPHAFCRCPDKCYWGNAVSVGTSLDKRKAWQWEPCVIPDVNISCHCAQCSRNERMRCDIPATVRTHTPVKHHQYSSSSKFAGSQVRSQVSQTSTCHPFHQVRIRCHLCWLGTAYCPKWEALATSLKSLCRFSIFYQVFKKL